MKNANMAWLVLGALVGALLYRLLDPSEQGHEMGSEARKEPLYWVAPMDPNYRRDGPGKSPMGMDLVPYYGDADSSDAAPGTVRISADTQHNLGVRIAAVERRDVQRELRLPGVVHYAEDLLTHVHPRVAGWIETLHVEAVGDAVERGQPLYRLYAPTLINAQEDYLLALKRNNRDLIEAAQARLQSLQLNATQIAAIAQSGAVNQSVLFTAPQSGVLDRLTVREGFYVQPGDTLMSIGSIERVWVEAQVDVRQLDDVHAGQAVSMRLDARRDESFSGRVDRIEPTVDPVNRTARLRVIMDNPEERLKPNMLVHLTLHTHASERLVVPREAVIRTAKSNRVVRALDDGAFLSTAVQTGAYFDDWVEILSGLDAGDAVVVSAQFLLDSESSLRGATVDAPAQAAPALESAWTTATVHAVDTAERRMDVSHGAIDAWGWPAMRMRLPVAEGVNLKPIEQAHEAHIQISRSGSDARVTGVHWMGPVESPAPPENGPAEPDDAESPPQTHQHHDHGAARD